MSAARPDGLLFEGPLGRMRPEDVLQFVAQAGMRARVSFATGDRVHGWPRAVDLVIDDGRIVGLGPRGTGLRLGDLVVARGARTRRQVEAAATAPPGPAWMTRAVMLSDPPLRFASSISGSTAAAGLGARFSTAAGRAERRQRRHVAEPTDRLRRRLAG